VVDESGVAEEGRHDELIAAGGIYRRLTLLSSGRSSSDPDPGC
jgi:ABC-type multidrug transport system fused ATPase/permease subunit